MTLLTIAEAAEHIGVSQRQIRNLAASGDIRLVVRGAVDADSVSSFLRDRGQVARRVWNEETAWAAVGLLVGDDISWLGAAQASRLRRQVTGMDAAELASRLRNRATVRRYDGHRSVIDRVADQLVAGQAAIGDLTVARGTDGYLDETDLADLVARFRLRATGDGALTVRVTRHLDKARAVASQDGELLTALDLATSVDARERETALAVIADRVSRL